MASLLTYTYVEISQWANNVVGCHLDGIDILNYLDTQKGGSAGTDWATLATAIGAPDAATAQAIYNAVNQTKGYQQNANDAVQPIHSL